MTDDINTGEDTAVDDMNNAVLADDSDFDVEIVDDTPEKDKGKPRRAEGTDPQIPDDDEIAQYGESVQKRIKQLRYEYHEERRAKEEAARAREEAIRYAESVNQENQRLQRILSEGEGVLVRESKGRLQAELDRARRAYREAYEAGDTDKVLEAQEQISQLQHERIRLESYRPAPQQQQQQQQYRQPPQQRPQPQAPAVATPPPEAQAWAAKNTWFGRDEEMTGFALGVHERLVKSGVAPNSPTYYTQIDAAMRKRFADNFGDDTVEVSVPSARPSGNVVAPASRGSKKPRQTVQLTKSADDIRKRLGLTREQYAAQLMKERTYG